jgi:Domain of Unknown Function (DUF1080)
MRKPIWTGLFRHRKWGSAVKLTMALLIASALWALSQPPQQAGQSPVAVAPPGGGGRRGPTPFDFADNEGWVSLFNGENLNGWDGDTRFWGVKDGSIYVEPTCEKPTGTIYLVWQGGDVSDFMLKFESKGTGNVNGGVQFRSYLTAENNVGLKYPGRGGGGMLANATPGRGPGGPGLPAGDGAGRGQGGPGSVAARGPAGGGRGPQCANPGTPPTTAERAKWDMAGPQFDFDANNAYPGQYYEQSSSRGIAAAPGTAVLAEPGGRKLLATLADKATRDSWFKKDDYNEFLLIAKGNTSTMYMNGHLMSVFIDNDPGYFRPSGKIGLEVESTGAYYTRNIWLKRM